jgi:hypothetical protein
MSTAHSSPSPSGGRLAAVIAGGVAVALAVLLLAAGGLLLWADGQKDTDGYLSSDTGRFATPTVALATENLDVDVDGAGPLTGSKGLGKVRLRAESRDGKRVFVGIARSADVQRYLHGRAHATITDVETSPLRGTTRTEPGAPVIAAPDLQRFWAASSYGAGQRELRWKVQDGDWSVVVMNADGAPGVDADVSAGADLPLLTALGWSVLGGGGLLLLTGGGLIAFGLVGRRRRMAGRGPAAPAPSAA